MDRDAGKEDRGETVKRKCGVRSAECGTRSAECGVRIIVILVGVILIYLFSFSIGISYAEENSPSPHPSPLRGEGKGEGVTKGFSDEKKIELEKTEIFGVLERPATIFPVRWKDPEAPDEKTYTLKRSFKREILEFVDMDNINANIKSQKSK